MICLYLLLALFSCDLAQSRGVPLWYKEIESLIANHLSSNDEEMTVATREGVEYTGTLSEIEHFLKYDSSNKGQDIVFNHNFDLEDSMEVVIGTDERHLQNPNIYPFTAMGRIEIGCTGTFISPHVVLTAGHCVYSRNGQYYSRLAFYRGKHCNAVYSSKHEFSRIFTYRKWRTSRDTNYDIAWIVYETPSPVHMPYTRDTPPVGTEISIYGYPGDKAHQCLWGSSKPLTVIYKKQLQYEVDTAGGMSGSAIYYNDGGNPVIIGVHTTGFPGRFNRGTRMTNKYRKRSDKIIRIYD